MRLKTASTTRGGIGLYVFLVLVSGLSRSLSVQGSETLDVSSDPAGVASSSGPTIRIDTGGESGPVDPRIRASSNVVSQVADLIDNVSQCISSNLSSDNPAVANQRLLETAADMASDVLKNTRADGRKVFVTGTSDHRSPLASYSRISESQHDLPASVSNASMAIREAVQVFKSLNAGSILEAQRSIDVLNQLGQRVRGSMSHHNNNDVHQSIDMSA